ncbi:hypothetical protein PR048_026435 [Dryococelus australis]|uniref:Uncharacterized protein n=1 Tax=Dryococelus australis TaxID=614101 RepID=A0ABQ9GLC8_9NEOP|nr:hypothetical protein PR048_026435 [Dryococelus australis]
MGGCGVMLGGVWSRAGKQIKCCVFRVIHEVTGSLCLLAKLSPGLDPRLLWAGMSLIGSARIIYHTKPTSLPLVSGQLAIPCLHLHTALLHHTSPFWTPALPGATYVMETPDFRPWGSKDTSGQRVFSGASPALETLMSRAAQILLLNFTQIIDEIYPISDNEDDGMERWKREGSLAKSGPLRLDLRRGWVVPRPDHRFLWVCGSYVDVGGERITAPVRSLELVNCDVSWMHLGCDSVYRQISTADCRFATLIAVIYTSSPRPRPTCQLRQLPRQYLPYNGVAPEYEGGGNWRSPRKPTDQRHSQTQFPIEKFGSVPDGNITQFALVGGKQANYSANVALHNTQDRGVQVNSEALVYTGPRSMESTLMLWCTEDRRVHFNSEALVYTGPRIPGRAESNSLVCLTVHTSSYNRHIGTQLTFLHAIFVFHRYVGTHAVTNSIAAVVKRLDCSPPTMANWVQSMAGSLPGIVPDDATGRRVFSVFSRPCIPPLLCTHLTSPFFGSQDLDVKSRPNLSTQLRCEYTHYSTATCAAGSEGCPRPDWLWVVLQGEVQKAQSRGRREERAGPENVQKHAELVDTPRLLDRVARAVARCLTSAQEPPVHLPSSPPTLHSSRDELPESLMVAMSTLACETSHDSCHCEVCVHVCPRQARRTEILVGVCADKALNLHVTVKKWRVDIRFSHSRKNVAQKLPTTKIDQRSKKPAGCWSEETLQHSPGVMSANHGRQKPRCPYRDTNPDPPECDRCVATATPRLMSLTIGWITLFVRGPGSVVVRLLASHPGQPSSISGGVAPVLSQWKSCRAMPLVGGFSRGSPVSPALAFWRCSFPTSLNADYE